VQHTENNNSDDYVYHGGKKQLHCRPLLHTYLLLLDARLLLYPRQYLGHVGLEHHPAHDQLGQDEVDLGTTDDWLPLSSSAEIAFSAFNWHCAPLLG